MSQFSHTDRSQGTALKVVRPKPFRLSQAQRDSLCSAVEAAINGGWDELRIYWPGGEIASAPMRVGKRCVA